MARKVGKERYKRYMIFEEDRTDVYALFNTAESLKYIGKYGYLHIKTQGSSTNSDRSPNEKFFVIEFNYTFMVEYILWIFVFIWQENC